MGRTAAHGLSKHATKGYRISIGKKPDGGYRTFWLGQSRAVAEYHADALKAQFEHMRDAHRDVWTDADVERVTWHVREFKSIVAATHERHRHNVAQLNRTGAVINAVLADEGAARKTAHRPAAKVDTPATRALKLHAAIDAYVAAFQAKAVSAAHRERTRQLLEDLKHYREDVPLAEIDRVWLQTLTDFIRSRPISRARKTRLAPMTVRNTLRAWARFFDWLDANADGPRFGGWQAPRRSAELFEVRLAAMMTKAERDARADGPKHLTSEQVVRLYQAARNDLHRICVALGVFAALGQTEISTLRRDEFDLTSATLTHRRSKTGQLGKFWLPLEVVTLIRRYFRTVRKSRTDVAFETADGSPLVTETSDAVRQAWTDLVDRVNRGRGKKVEKVAQGFYALRKFTADYAMREGGPVLRDAFLAHAPASVGARFYSNTRDFDAVFALGKRLAAELRSLGMFELDAPELPRTRKGRAPRAGECADVSAGGGA